MLGSTLLSVFSAVLRQPHNRPVYVSRRLYTLYKGFEALYEYGVTIFPYTESAHKEELLKKGQTSVPIGALDDVEIVFLHFHSEKEAAEKWERRKKRIHWDNIYYKFSEMNDCEYLHLKAFDELPTTKKFMFTAKEYPEFSSAVFFNVGG